MLLGAHVSVAGGVDTSFKRAVELNCTAFQIFTKSNRQWKAKPLNPEEIERYHEQQVETGITPVICHASYLLNLGQPLMHDIQSLRHTRQAGLDAGFEVSARMNDQVWNFQPFAPL